jgi:hypothetical protein
MREIVADLTDEHRALQFKPGGKTAGWLIGHLCVTGDFGRRLCGRTPICPKEWRPVFNPGSQPSDDASVYPSMETLCRTAETVYADLCEAAPAADPALLAIDNPYVPARATMPTAGAFVRYLMTGHFAYHLGQLSEWRVGAGMTSRRQLG